VVVSAESALPEVVGEAGASVAGEDLAAGVTTVLSWPEPARRAAARARAEHFGWPAAVRAFLAIHEALVAGEARGGDRLVTDEAAGPGQAADGMAAGAGARAAVTAERRRA
jgi:alpha-1,6-mannosyltransferase